MKSLICLTIFLLLIAQSKVISVSSSCNSIQPLETQNVASNETAFYFLDNYFNGPNLQYKLQGTNQYSQAYVNPNFDLSSYQNQNFNWFPYNVTETKSYVDQQGKIVGASAYLFVGTHSTPIFPFNVTHFVYYIGVLTPATSLSQAGGYYSSGTAYNPNDFVVPYTNLNGQILNVCYDFEFLSQTTVVVDCYNATSNQNFLIVYDFNTLANVSKIFYSPNYLDSTQQVIQRSLKLYTTPSGYQYILRTTQYANNGIAYPTDSFIEPFLYNPASSNNFISTQSPIDNSSVNLTQALFQNISVSQSGFYAFEQKTGSIFKFQTNFTSVITPEYTQYQFPLSKGSYTFKMMTVNSNDEILVTVTLKNQQTIQASSYYLFWPQSAIPNLPASVYSFSLPIGSFINSFFISSQTITDDYIMLFFGDFGDQIATFGNLDLYTFQKTSQQGILYYQSNNQYYSQALPFFDQFGEGVSIFNNYVNASNLKQITNKIDYIQMSIPYLMLQAANNQNTAQLYSVNIVCTSGSETINNQKLVQTNVEPKSMTEFAFLQPNPPNTNFTTQFPGQLNINLDDFFQGSNLQFNVSFSNPNITYTLNSNFTVNKTIEFNATSNSQFNFSFNGMNPVNLDDVAFYEDIRHPFLPMSVIIVQSVKSYNVSGFFLINTGQEFPLIIEYFSNYPLPGVINSLASFWDTRDYSFLPNQLVIAITMGANGNQNSNGTCQLYLFYDMFQMNNYSTINICDPQYNFWNGNDQNLVNSIESIDFFGGILYVSRQSQQNKQGVYLSNGGLLTFDMRSMTNFDWTINFNCIDSNILGYYGLNEQLQFQPIFVRQNSSDQNVLFSIQQAQVVALNVSDFNNPFVLGTLQIDFYNQETQDYNFAQSGSFIAIVQTQILQVFEIIDFRRQDAIYLGVVFFDAPHPFGITTQDQSNGIFCYSNNYLYLQQHGQIYIYRINQNAFSSFFTILSTNSLHIQNLIVSIEQDGTEYLIVQGSDIFEFFFINDHQGMEIQNFFNLTQFNNNLIRGQNYNFTINATSGNQIAQQTFTMFSYFEGNQINIQATSKSYLGNPTFDQVIQLDTTQQGRQVFSFPSSNWFNGTIVNFSISCGSCNNSQVMRLDNVISYNRSISTNQEGFIAVVKGQKFSYAQSKNRVFRLNYQNNTIRDLIQLPFNDYKVYCPKIVVSDDETYSVSFCSDSESWWVWVVSYLSTEPFVAGSYPVQTALLSSVFLIDNYLFLVDGMEFLQDGPFNGVHVYRFNYGNPTAQQDLEFLFTFTQSQHMLQQAWYETVTNFDVFPSYTSNQLNIFVTTDSGNFYYIPFFENSGPIYINLQFESVTNIYSTIQAALNANAKFQYITIFNSTSNYSSKFDLIQGVAVFKDYNSYEISAAVHPQGSIHFQIQNVFLRYSYFENMPNVQVTERFAVIQAKMPIVPPTNIKYLGYFEYLFIYDRWATANNSNTYVNLSNVLTGEEKNMKFKSSYAPNCGAMTILGGQGFNSFGQKLNYIAQSHPPLIPSDQLGFSILMINPETANFDSFYLMDKPQFEFFTSDLPDTEITLIAQSQFSSFSQTFKINKLKVKGKSKAWIAAAVLGPIAGIAIIGGLVYYFKKKQHHEHHQQPLLTQT